MVPGQHSQKVCETPISVNSWIQGNEGDGRGKERRGKEREKNQINGQTND
jgi:hypothetical protein